MNLFLDYQEKIFISLKNLEKKKVIRIPSKIRNFTVELPPKNQRADISCNAAMILARANNNSPIKLAEILKKHLLINFIEFKSIEIAGPGFLNIYFHISFWKKYLTKIIHLNSKYGSNMMLKKKYNIEFVSANPTGPLHVGHCRGAVLGDTLSNLLIFNGNKVTREYYVNDYGGQIKNFVSSVYYRILEIIEDKFFPHDQNLYPGDYIIDIAKKIIKKKSIKNFENFEKIEKKLSSESLKFSMELIMNNLILLGVKHNNFVYESKIIKSSLVSRIVKKLEKKKYVYKGKLEPPKGEKTKEWRERDQLLFKSTLFGDDVDRPLQKADGTWTYFSGDMAYHANKVSRKFDVLINILGADHSGYTKRIISATKAISNNKTNLICKISQLVKLLKNGQPFKMSKRKGDYITVEDLIKEVGRDSTRFMMLSRSNDVELEFDFEKVTEKVISNSSKIVSIHSEDEDILNLRKKFIKKGDVSSHPLWRNEECAMSSTRRVVKIAERYNKKIHVLHVTTKEEVEFLSRYKGNVSFEITPQHLTISAPHCYRMLGSLAQMNPPIREKKHQDMLWKAIKDGIADMIGSDHAPHSLENKKKEYPQTSSGMPGVQTLVPLMLNHVNNNKLTLNQFIKLVCENPVRIFGIKNKGYIKEGYDADLTIVDMNMKKVIKNDWIASKCGWTPFDGYEVKGFPLGTIVNGKAIVWDGKLIEKANGRPLKF